MLTLWSLIVRFIAMMEYHWNKEPKVATNVFELGLKTFSENIDYVGRYLDFLMATNDDTSELYSKSLVIGYLLMPRLYLKTPALSSNAPCLRCRLKPLALCGTSGSVMRVASVTCPRSTNWTRA